MEEKDNETLMREAGMTPEMVRRAIEEACRQADAIVDGTMKGATMADIFGDKYKKKNED